MAPPSDTASKKVCLKCHQTYPLTTFRRDKNISSGYHSWCKFCTNLAAKQWKAKNAARVKRVAAHASRKRRYGLSIEDFDILILRAEGRCDCCDEILNPFVERGIHIDHCHVTGEVRGLLCVKCNSMLGMARDKIENLEAGIQYLRRFKCE